MSYLKRFQGRSRGKKRMVVLTSLIAVGVLSGALIALAGHVDLTNPPLPGGGLYDPGRTATPDQHMFADGSLVEYIDPVGSTGTGLFDSFLRLQAQGNNTVEVGYNTDGVVEFDAKDDPFTHAILLSDIPAIKVGDVIYREFVADLNEGNAAGDEFLTFDYAEIYLTGDPNLTGYPFGASATLAWSMPEALYMVDYQSGSGDGDMRLLVPTSNFVTAEDCGYGSTTCETYLVFYAEHGQVDGDSLDGGVEGGFEEWGVLNRPKLNVVKTGDGLITPSVADWVITKTPDGAYSHFAGEGDSHDFDITVYPELGNDSVTVQGTIVVSNVGDVEAILTHINDEFQGQNALLICPDIQAGEFPAGELAVPYELGAGDQLSCTYVIPDPTGDDGDFNVAEVIAADPIAASGSDDQVLSLSAEVEITFVHAPAVGFTQVDVIDNDGSGDVVLDSLDYNVNGDGPFLYDWDYAYTCPTDTGLYTDGHYALPDYVNEARVEGVVVHHEDSATVTVDCYVPVTDKTAAGTYDVNHTWEITKADDGNYSLFAGESVLHDYVITVDETETPGEGTVSGQVSVANPNPDDAMTVTVDDVLSDGTVVSLTDCASASGAIAANVDGTYTIPAGETMTCDYSATDGDRDVTSNTVTATLDTGVSDSTTTGFDYVVTDSGPTSVDVTDVNEQDGESVLGTTDGDVIYDTSSTYTCPTETSMYDADGWYQFTVNNTAYAMDGAVIVDQDSAVVTVDCYVPVTDKTAAGTYDVNHTWEITKADDGNYSLFAGESVLHDYVITVDETETPGEGTVSGQVSVANPNPDDAMTVTVDDVLSDGTVVSLTDCASASGAIAANVDGTYTIPAGETMTCDYSATDGDRDVTSNTVTATLDTGVSDSTTTGFDYVVTDSGPTSVDVTDVNEQDGESVLGTTDGDVIYDTSSTYTCPTETSMYDADGWYQFTVNNTAYAMDGAVIVDQDSAVVTVDCWILNAEKEVTPSFTRTYDYTIDKEAMYYSDPTNAATRMVLPDGQEINLMHGESYMLEWDLVVGGNGFIDSDHEIDTTITVYNNSGMDATGVDIVDATVGLSCLGVTVPANGSYECSQADFATDDTLTTNTASVTRGLVEHATPSDSWDWSTPTTLVNDVVDVEDLFGAADIDLSGELMNASMVLDSTVAWSEVDEVGETKTFTLKTLLSTDPLHNPDQLLFCGPNEVVNDASVIGDLDVVLDTDTDAIVVNVICNDTCTLTQGYWRTHSAAGPRGNHDAYTLYNSIWKHRDATWDDITVWSAGGPVAGNEDSLFFLSGMTYWQVQWEPIQGDKYYSLAHQYIAAQLNIQANANELGISFDAALATAPAAVQEAYGEATDFFEVNSPTGKFRGKAARDVTANAATLASFNEGDFAGWPHCDDIPESIQELNARLGL